MKINDILFEFAPPGSGDSGDDGFSEETLKRLASQWYNGDEDPRVERTLMAAGWEIGQDEGYDEEPGVFVVQSGDVNGNSYISWPAHELKQGLNEFAPGGGGMPPRGPKTPGRNRWGGDDDGSEDPYGAPKPKHYDRSIDFFGQFEADHFDDEAFDKQTGVFKGYWFDRDAKDGRIQIASFRFDDPRQAAKNFDDSPGTGWYYEPPMEGVAEEISNDERQKTYNYVYQIMVKQAPEFMYRASNEDVKKAIVKAMSFGNQITPHDMASYAYGMLKNGDINEQGMAEDLDSMRNQLSSGGYMQSQQDREQDRKRLRQQRERDREQDRERLRQRRGQEDQRYDAERDAASQAYIARWQHEIDVLAHRLKRMDRDDDDWERTYDMLRDRINRYQYSTQRDVDPKQLAAISNIQYQPRRKKTDFVPDETGVPEGIEGEIAGGVVGNVVGGAAGSTLGPIGGAIGSTLGGSVGSAIGSRYQDGKPLKEKQQLDEIAPLLAAGVRLFMAAAPKIAQVMGKTGRAGAEITAKNAHKIGLGAGAYEIGSSVADIAKDITAKVGQAVDEKTIFELATMAFKYAIPAGIVLAIMYGGKKAIDSLFSDKEPKPGVAEGKPKEKEADYGPDYQDMVARVKKLAGLGPLRTVYDPQKRVYKNVPIAVQPKKEQR